MPTAPDSLANEELEPFSASSPLLSVSCVESLDRLRELWLIDQEAYGDCSIAFKIFEQWWRRYRFGSINLLCDNQIIASLGLWPLPEQVAIDFASGRIAERDLLPMPLEECERSPQQHWYASGIVVVSSLRRRLKTNPLKPLLQRGLNHWASSGHISYPMSMIALAEYPAGQNILRRIGFSQERSSNELPDGCPLYRINLASEEEMRSLLKARRL